MKSNGVFATPANSMVSLHAEGGLKLPDAVIPAIVTLSPSMRREWIEIPVIESLSCPTLVSLHAEGVD